MDNENMNYIGCGLSAILTALQTEEVFREIQLAFTIIATLVTIAFTIYKWYKRAKADNKITSEEIGDLLEDVKDTLDNASEKIDKENQNDKN